VDLILFDILPYSTVEEDAFKRLNFAEPAESHRNELKTDKYEPSQQTDCWERTHKSYFFWHTTSDCLIITTELCDQQINSEL